MSARQVDLDLDALRAAREEAEEHPKVVAFKGERFELPPKMPARLMFAVGEIVRVRESSDGEELVRAYVEAAEAALGSSLQRFLSLDPSIEDLELLITQIPKLYGQTAGEPQASGSSSSNDGSRSRPTSPATTASTSPKPSSERGRSARAGSAR